MLETFVPPVVSRVQDIAAIWAAVEPEFSIIEENIKRLPLSVAASTADETAIEHFEAIYKLPFNGASLAERRERCEAVQRTVRPFTLLTLERVLEALVGGREAFNYELDKDYKWLRIYLDASEPFFEDVFKLLRGFVPANLTLTIEPYSVVPTETVWHLLDEEGMMLTDEDSYILTDEEVE